MSFRIDFVALLITISHDSPALQSVNPQTNLFIYLPANIFINFMTNIYYFIINIDFLPLVFHHANYIFSFF